MRDINGAGFDPSVEDINVTDEEDICEDCGGELVMKLLNDDVYYKCLDCGVII